MSAEWIAKLTAKMRQIDGAGFGGTPEISSIDIAAALSGSHRRGYLLVLTKYADDNSAGNALWSELAEEIKRERVCSHDVARGVALACIYPVVNPSLCGVCNGRGYIYPRLKDKTIEEAARPCSSCRGIGRTNFPERQRAIIARIPKSTWWDRWKEYAAEKEEYLWLLESSTLQRMREQLKVVA